MRRPRRGCKRVPARNDYDDGRHVEMRNCNFFQIEDGRFKHVTIYMTDENPLV